MIDPLEAAVALGSNVGDRHAELAAAVDFLRSLADGAAIEVSPWIESDPVDCPPGSPGFLNGVVILRFTGTTQELLAACRAFERRRGRDHALARNSPRPLDLDLLFHGMREIATADRHAAGVEEETKTLTFTYVEVPVAALPKPEGDAGEGDEERAPEAVE